MTLSWPRSAGILSEAQGVGRYRGPRAGSSRFAPGIQTLDGMEQSFAMSGLYAT